MGWHSQTVYVTDQEILINDEAFWVEGKVHCSGTLHEEVIGGECHGTPSFTTVYQWEPTEGDVLEMKLVRLDELGEEFPVFEPELNNLAKAKIKEIAFDLGQENLEL